MKYHLHVFSVCFATHRAWQQAVISSVCACVHACAHACERERECTCLWSRVSHVHL